VWLEPQFKQRRLQRAQTEKSPQPDTNPMDFAFVSILLSSPGALARRPRLKLWCGFGGLLHDVTPKRDFVAGTDNSPSLQVVLLLHRRCGAA
jgi:hypothetical protein